MEVHVSPEQREKLDVLNELAALANGWRQKARTAHRSGFRLGLALGVPFGALVAVVVTLRWVTWTLGH